MISRHRSMLTIFSCLALTAPLTTALAEPPVGRLLASQCAQCHGTNGKAVGDMESLAGESVQELYDEMLEMKNSNKTGDIMHRQAKGYDESQLWLIAQYYAGLSGGEEDRNSEGDRNREGEHDSD